MKVSINWLKEYISLDGVSANELANALTTAGLEIEGVEPVAKGTNLVIGEVLSCVPHPDSDHLNVCMVEYGEGPTQIVCGAPNCTSGIKVIVAKVGAELPAITIKAAKVRGQESNGMLCSLRELGVNEKYLTEAQINGIEILPNDAPVGNTEVLKYLGYDDVVLDASQTPNRADCMAMWSVAKEVGAVLRREAKLPSYEGASKIGNPTTLKIISKSEKCPHFLGKIVGKVIVKESPKWMQDYLHAAGIRAINNVVDISNYVMLETGQPLHFYDLAKMPHKEITVIDDVDMKLTALDGIEYEVQKGDLLITTGGKATGIAGIMGGDDSKIDETTTGIIIEAAHFNHVSIRNTAKRLGLMTEAASRYIKGLEPLAQNKAVDRAVQLLIEYADASELEETVEAGCVNYSPIQVTETLEHCNELLGTTFKMDEVTEVLKALDFNPVVNGTSFTCTIPSYRTDIFIREDIDEEIIRLIGFDSLNKTLPKMEATAGKLTHRQALRRETKQVFTGLGMREVITYTLVKEQYMNDAVLPFGQHIQLASPMSEDRKYIRNSMMPSMLECLAYNQARKADNVNLFEISNVYEKDKVQERVGILLSDSLQENRLQKVDIKSDFFTLKGIVMSWLAKLGFASERIVIKENTLDTIHFHPYRSAEVYLQNDLIGIIGEVHPTYAKAMDVAPCVYAELNFDLLVNAKGTKVRFVPLDRYPSVSRDIALVVTVDTTAQSILDIIKKVGKRLIQSTEVFDVYQGEHVEKGCKSIALNIVYQATDHTLTDDEVVPLHQEILSELESKLNAKLRG
ncbi:phenylalanine--tRNA ligase subunit beta [Anaerorhabdus furcosa]|uniref:Phenylalanine--tRNA ligase beta subunit n=1 Tax=Anaerorhabdus furcosa TaxID=118967 RepID=A0A1T4JVC0_9FIRM|nr:phenylalanine--tRNA ligase subunit beta [Anaerorhabdus furcosa]SJZ34093.1 phenylalanyl-tRNA synthetase beta subunit [Anaerorhabdus furcosa]